MGLPQPLAFTNPRLQHRVEGSENMTAEMRVCEVSKSLMLRRIDGWRKIAAAQSQHLVGRVDELADGTGGSVDWGVNRSKSGIPVTPLEAFVNCTGGNR